MSGTIESANIGLNECVRIVRRNKLRARLKTRKAFHFDMMRMRNNLDHGYDPYNRVGRYISEELLGLVNARLSMARYATDQEPV